MSDKAERVEFLAATGREPSASALLFGLAGATAALEQLTREGGGDRDLIGNLAAAADCLARLLVDRMGQAPAGPDPVGGD